MNLGRFEQNRLSASTLANTITVERRKKGIFEKLKENHWARLKL